MEAKNKKTKPVKLKKDGTPDKRVTSKKTGAPKGNQNAIGNSGRPQKKWTKKKAIAFGNDLITWMKSDNTHIFFNEFIVLERGLYVDIINDLRAKFIEFDRIMKIADEIQLTKIMKWSSVNKLNPSVSIFIMKTKHGLKEVNGLEHSGSIKTLADIARESDKNN